MKIVKCTLFVFSIFFQLSSCEQESRNVSLFKGTQAYSLAKEVEKENLRNIEKIVRKNPQLLDVVSSSGANVLAMCLYIEKMESFKKLLELGANPNFINPYSRESVLIQACKPFGGQSEWKINNSYAELLLKYGADPNYSVEEEFTDQNGHFHLPTTALMKASSLNLELVILLIKNGADPKKKLKNSLRTSFSEAVMTRKFDIVDYYIDSVKVDVKEPMSINLRRPKNEVIEFYIQDYIKHYMNFKENSKGFEQKQKLINKLKKMGVDFNTYQYKY